MGAGVVAGLLEGQQVALRVDRALEDSASAVLVARDVVFAAGHEQNGRLDTRQPLGVPEARRHAPRGDRHGGPDPRVEARLERLGACLPLGQETVRRREAKLRAGLGEAAADDVDQSIPTHRVPDDPGARRVDQAAQEALARRRAPIHLVHDEQLVEGPVVQRARERRLIGVGAVGVVDGDDDVALARQVLAEVGDQEAVAGVPVRQDHERVWAAVDRGLGVPALAQLER